MKLKFCMKIHGEGIWVEEEFVSDIKSMWPRIKITIVK